MGRTRKENLKVRITIRAYVDTIQQIKASGSSLQQEWDKHIETKYQENCKKKSE